MRTFVRYWLPVVFWMAVIYVASTDLFAAQHTSRFIGPLLRWLVPDISPQTIMFVQLVVRKAAHVMEYAILAVLLFRALLAGRFARSGWLAFASIIGAAVCAAADEYHQSFVRSRTGSPLDVMIDLTGALLGIAVYWWAMARRARDTSERLAAPSPRVIAR